MHSALTSPIRGHSPEACGAPVVAAVAAGRYGHAAVSAGWYGTAPRVPTYLYAAVHVYGALPLVNDADAMRDRVMELSGRLEAPDSGWSAEAIAPYIDRLMGGIVAFEIGIARMQIQLRASQQNGPNDLARVIAALQRGTPAQQQAAELARRFGHRKDSRRV